MTKNRSEKIINILKKYYGNPDTELSFKNIFELVISVVLSAQTTDKQVAKVKKALFHRFPDFKSLSKATLFEVESIIKSCGLYKNKAKNIINLSNDIIHNYKGEIPENFEELIKLPGIGRKSANIILSMGFGKAAFAVDTHIIRVANRVGYIKSNNPYKVERAITSLVSKNDWNLTHLLFIKHGKKICNAKKPLCPVCPINSYCDNVKNIV